MILFNEGGNIYPEVPELVKASNDFFAKLKPYIDKMDPIEVRAFEAWIIADIAYQFNATRLNWAVEKR